MRKILIAVLAVGALCGAAWALTIPSYINAEDYEKMSREQRVSYMQGLSDMMSRMCIEVSNMDATSDAAIFCRRMDACVKPMTGNQLTDFVEGAMRDASVKPNTAMSSVFRGAINMKCPGTPMS